MIALSTRPIALQASVLPTRFLQKIGLALRSEDVDHKFSQT